ncbi:MAG: OmpA family protein [Ginsengibacter sp.]
MTKKLPLFFLFISFFTLQNAYSQDFLGLSTGNNAGVTGVMLQPASIVDSRYKFDINLFSTGVNYSNNYFLLNRDVILKFNKKNFDNYETFKSKYLSVASLPAGEKVFFNVHNRTQLPLSFMATTGKKSAIALNMQLRTAIQGRGISQELARAGYENFYYPPLNNTTINASGINIHSLNWAEAGLTYGRVLYSSDKHFIKAAITGKYLAGLSSINLSSNDLQFRINSDSTFDINSSNVSYHHNKNADFNKLFDKNFKPDANAFGFDAGLVYEYRGNIEDFKYIKKDDEKSYDAVRRDINKYIFKVGVSLLDVGMFRFNKPAEVNSFRANIQNWDLRNAQYKTINDFDTALAARVIANPNDPRRYNVYLPTALSGQLDVKFVKGLFLNVMSYWPLDIGNKEGERFDKFGFYTITPRFETRHFGIYIPYTVMQRNDFSDYNNHLLGATFRMGPLFVGSSNLGTMLFNKNLRAADVHVGLKVGITYGKPTKSNRFIDKVFKTEKADMMYKTIEEEKIIKIDSAHSGLPIRQQLILNYKDGNVYSDPGARQNVIIINNYHYYGNTNKAMGDTLISEREFERIEIDSVQARNVNDVQMQNKKTADSLTKITTDSLKLKKAQLDSLIKSMQKLQMQMDSTNRIDILMEKERTLDSTKNKVLLNTHRDKSVVRDSISFMRKDSLNLLKNDDQVEVGKKKVDRALLDSLSGKDSVESYRMSDIKRDSVEVKPDSLIFREDFKREPVFISEQSANDRARINAPDRENALKSIQEQQDRLLRDYAVQASRLAQDIDRLNRRVETSRRRKVDNFIPVPVPVNNFQKAERIQSDPIIKTDTIYIRDTIALVPKKTTQPDSLTQNIDPNKNLIRDTVKIRDTVAIQKKVPMEKFNYPDLPDLIILFGVGQSTILPLYESQLQFFADVLKRNSDMRVLITGHTDSTGSVEVNKKLSRDRAQAVADNLAEKGLSVNQMVLESHSYEEPAVSGSGKSARSQNRRVTLRFLEKNK